MRPDNTNNIKQEHAEPSILKNGFRFLSRPLQAAFLLSLASCVQPQWQMWSQWKYGRITPAQADAAQIQPPNGVRIVQPGTPISYQDARRTRIAQPQPHSYPQHARNSHTNTYTAEQIKMMNFYGVLYDEPKKALAPWPAYALNYPRSFGQHTVQQGQTFSWICEMYGLDRRPVWDFNKHLKDPNRIFPGQIVYIPHF